MYFVQLFGLMLSTLGVCGLVFPFVPSDAGGSTGTSAGQVLGSLALLAGGVLLFLWARRAD